MKPGDRLSPEELRSAVDEAVSASGQTHQKIADELEVTRGAISRATNESATKLSGLQRRIIAHLTPYSLREERTVEYVVEENNG
jgi:predicted transcriptional regulator